VSVNAFNVFNFQQVTGLANDYTLKTGVVPIPQRESCDRPQQARRRHQRRPAEADGPQPNFWRPAAYQPVRQVRFQARLTF
jgi:hypothetical protein